VSLERLLEHRRTWQRKQVLSGVYEVWFAALLELLPETGRVLELGAGPGFLAGYAARHRPRLSWTSLDLIPTPWNDLAGDAQRLPFRAGSASAVVAVDLIHHLARPALFFAEVARVLPAGGLLGVVEPWLSPFSHPVYRFLHEEGYRPALDPWRPFADGAGKDAFEGDSGVVTNLVRGTSESEWRALGLEPPGLRLFGGFAYLLSGGFRRLCLLPRALLPVALRVDRAARAIAPLVALRALVTWRRAAWAPGASASSAPAVSPAPRWA